MATITLITAPRKSHSIMALLPHASLTIDLKISTPVMMALVQVELMTQRTFTKAPLCKQTLLGNNLLVMAQRE